MKVTNAAEIVLKLKKHKYKPSQNNNVCKCSDKIT